MTGQIRRLALAFAAAFGLAALTTGYWAIIRRDALLDRADNPRRVLAERRIRRGTIYDRDGAVLAESLGAPGDFERRYPHPALAPVLGYISPFYGAAGIEAATDAVLHGDAGRSEFDLWWGTVLGAPPPGRAVRLSLDLRLQSAADAALGDRAGAVVVLDASTGEILALASHPTFDPNQLDAQWEAVVADPRAPLLNRATLALYQPGGALEPLILAAALRAGLADVNSSFPLAGTPVAVGGLTVGCRVAPGVDSLTLAAAFALGCPRPFGDLGGRLGEQALDQLFSDFRLFDAPPLAIPTIASPHPDLGSEARIAAMGQGSLTITPLHLALVTAAIAHQGEMPAPQLLIAVQNADGGWEPVAPSSHPIAAITSEAADQVKALMADGHKAVAFSGAESNTLAWFSGFAPFDDSRYAVAVLLEDGDVEGATHIGQELLKRAAGSDP